MMNNFDKNIEDYGWGEMKKLLDKEMPEGGVYIPASASEMPMSTQKEKNKRRWLVFFLLVSGLMASGLGYYLYQNPSSKTPIAHTAKQSIIEKKAVNTEGVVAPNKTASETEKTITEQRNTAPLPTNTPDASGQVEGVSQNYKEGINKNQNTNIDRKNKDFIQDNIVQRIDNQNIINKNDTATAAPALKNMATSEGRLKSPAIDFNPENPSISTLKGDNNNQNITPKTDITDVPISSKMTIQTLELLPIITGRAINFETPKIPNALPNTQVLQGRIVSLNIKNKPRLGLTIGANTEGVAVVMGGYQAGVFMQQKLPTKLPLSLQIGLNYRNTKATGDSLNITQARTYPVTISSPNQLTSTAITQATLNNISYIEIPLFLTYAPSKKWVFLAGVKGAYMISNKKGTTIWSANNRYVVENGFAGTMADAAFTKSSGNLFANTLDNFNQTLGFNRIDIAAVGGVSYLILPKTTLSLRADWGFKNILNKENWVAYNRFLGLNMSYQF